MSARTWLLGYTCDAHRLIGTDPLPGGLEVDNCACQPSLPLRICWWLGLRFLEEVTPHHPLATEEPRWCTHTWPRPEGGHWPNGEAREAHVCELPHGHGAPEHECDCGAKQPTEQAVARIHRMLKLPPRYDDCVWPEGGVCPRHDRALAWPAGRDCLGTCTVCNSEANAWHAPSCPHYDPDAVAEYDRLTRNHPDNWKA